MINHLLSELRHRGVIQTLTAYVVAAWLLIEIFDVAGPVFAIPAWVNSLVGVALVTGFPVAAYLAWFFNYSDGQIKRAGRSDGSDRPLGVIHWIGLGVIAAAAVGAGIVLFEQISDQLRKEEEGIAAVKLDETIAIVPFRDVSPDQDQAYLAEGIAAELSSTLARVDGVRTTSTSAAFRLAQQGMSPVDIARRLDAGSVLTGSVNASGNRLRLQLELIRTEDETVVWRDSFTRTLNDVFALEEEIARSITNLLVDRYVEADEIDGQTRTASSDAYIFYLKARAELRNRTTESAKTARKLFQQSVALDPEFAPAHVGIAETMWHLSEGIENHGALDEDVAATIARQSVERALLIDDQLPEAYANLGRAESTAQRHELALEHYDKAISLNPSLVDAYIWRFLALKKLHRYNESLSALHEALRLDPTAPAILFNLGYEESIRGNFAEAKEYFEALIQQEPDNPLGYRGLAGAAFVNGELALSLEKWGKVVALSPDTPQYQMNYRSTLFNLQMLEDYRPLAVAAGEEMNVLLLEGKYAEVHRSMDFSIAADPDDPWLKFEAGWYRYLGGDSAAADQLLIAADTAFSDEDRFAMPMCSPAIELVLAYRNQGDTERANTYLKRCEELLETTRDSVLVDSFLDHLNARIAALKGDEAAAVAAMEKAFENGWREWWTDRDPIFAELGSSAAMARVFARINSALDSERAKAALYLEGIADHKTTPDP